MSRGFVRIALVVGFVLTANGALQLVAAANAAPGRRPNVLVIVTDDQRAGTVKHMPRTRHWFARGGTDFSAAYATTPLCCPSRSSLFTGLYTHNHGVLTNQEGQAQHLDQTTTVQRRLSEAGYRTALIGKYLNGWGLEDPPPSFDYFAMFPGGYYDRRFNINGRTRVIQGYTTDYIAYRARRLLQSMETNDKRPWFLYVAPWAPHGRPVPEPDYENAHVPRLRVNPAMGEVDRTDKPPYVQESSTKLWRVKRSRRGQLRTLMSVDDLVEGVLAKLGKLDERERTLAFFMSDNGVLWGEHGILGKGLPYTAAVKVPMLVRWPGHLEPGRKDRRLVANIDVAPTILDAAGLNPHVPFDGRSLLRDWRRNRLLLEVFGSDRRPDIKWAANVTRRDQYIEYFAGESATPTLYEYYDLEGDSWQLLNLFGDDDPSNDPDVDDFSAILEADRRCRAASCP